MILITCLTVIAWNFCPDFMIKYLAKFYEPLHLWCLSHSPISNYQDFYQAIVCGQRVAGGTFQHNLQKSSLIHLIVVSGSHLILLSFFIDKILQKFSLQKLKYLSLILYAGMSLLQPPVVRSLSSLICTDISKRQYLFWTHYQVTWISFCICILIFPKWIYSYSFLMSVAASLALQMGHASSVLKRAVIVYLVMFPILLPLSAPHPLSILLNTLVGPILSLILFPLSLLSFILPLSKGVDLIWWGLDRGLAEISPLMQTSLSFSLPRAYLWVYVIGLNFYLIFMQIRTKRSFAFAQDDKRLSP